MAKRTASAVSRRASLRTQLKDATYSQLKGMFESGKLTESDLRLYYSDVRSDMQRQIKRIEKSDVKFVDKPDAPPSARTLKNPLDVAKAAAAANSFVQNKSMSTVKGRRAVRAKSIATLHSRGITLVNTSNYDLWIRFSRWYEQHAEHYKYGSDSPELLEIFEAADEQGLDSSEEWQDLFDNYIEDGTWL
jgi:hypothetical protein